MDPNPLIPQRLAAVRELLPPQNVDALLVTGMENRRYLSGFTSNDPDSGMLLITPKAALLLTDFRYRLWAENEAPDFEVVIYPLNPAQTLAELLQAHQVRRLGFEAAYVSYQQYQRLTQTVTNNGFSLEWQPMESLVEGLRQVKSVEELAAIKRALELTEAVLHRVARSLAPGQTEGQVAWEIEKALREGGAEAVAFPPIVAAGENSARPHHQPGNTLLKAGEPIIIDMGARLNGYCADMTRTFILGPPDEHFRKIYSLVREAQIQAEGGLRAGMDSLAADGLAREIIAAAGYGEAFGHSLGHGVGLAVHESPSLSPSQERRTILPAGCVVTVEPGIYLAGWGGVRLENMVVVRDQGAEVLNQTGFYEW